MQVNGLIIPFINLKIKCRNLSLNIDKRTSAVQQPESKSYYYLRQQNRIAVGDRSRGSEEEALNFNREDWEGDCIKTDAALAWKAHTRLLHGRTALALSRVYI